MQGLFFNLVFFLPHQPSPCSPLEISFPFCKVLGDDMQLFFTVEEPSLGLFLHFASLVSSLLKVEAVAT